MWTQACVLREGFGWGGGRGGDMNTTQTPSRKRKQFIIPKIVYGCG
jgi:hypothetical protein